MNHKYILIPILIWLFFPILQSVSAMSNASRLTAEFSYRQKQENEKYKANPYWCFQPDSMGNRLMAIAYSAGSTYVNACKYTWMTEEEHIEGVKMFVPYLNSPAEFFDSPTLWATFRAEILKIKSTKNSWTVEGYVDEVITKLKKQGNKFIKTDVSGSVLREFFLKLANEIDPVKEKQKQQAKKKQALADKKKKEKLIQDTIAPFAKYINKSKYEYVYNLMQEHYIKNLASVDDPTQSSYDNPYERLDDILGFAKEFADYVLIDWPTNPELVVKKWMEDALREAIMEDVMKRYPEVKTLYQEIPQ